MYWSSEFRDVENICYTAKHIKSVLCIIKETFEKDYFDIFLETCAGRIVSSSNFNKLKKTFGVISSGKNINQKFTDNYKSIIKSAIKDFESDREIYKEILDKEYLEEYEDDAAAFKSGVLKSKCPIIRKTLLNKRAKDLDSYRYNFNTADPNWLLKIVSNICDFAAEYKKNYNSDIYENIQSFEDLKMYPLDTEDYTAYGVIGGGIKSHMLYKAYPEIFPNRSRDAIWALWYLSKKKTFDCETDSEFLMIDTKASITQQNYFYPYRLFAYYAFEVYKLLKNMAIKYGLEIDVNYRYVIVDSFLKFIADENSDEINFLKSQIKDGGRGLA